MQTLRGFAVMAAAAVMLVAADAAAGSWVPRSVPATQGGTGRTAAVSCVGSTSCMAVGSFIDSVGKQRAITQAWNGTSWVIKVVPVPAGATRTRLAGVSCTAADACTAVGSYSLPLAADGGARDTYPLVVRWDGTAWTRQVVPLPSGANKAYFNGVSCTVTGGCMAVGGYRTATLKSGALAERFYGGAWAIITAPNPAGAEWTGLHGVSCTGTSCMAVGSSAGPNDATSELPGSSVPIAMQFNGTRWTLKALPASPGGSAMLGVSCTAASACTAVGGSSGNGGDFDAAIVARWNGSTWTAQAADARPEGHRRHLASVSCTSATKCTAVGPDTDSSGHADGKPHVERWEGRSWSKQAASVPDASGRYFAWFTGVSCNSAGCTAVGGQGASGASGEEGVPLAERQTGTGTSWVVQATPSGRGATRTQLSDVSCAGATSCVGVGGFSSSRTAGAVVAHWNGSTWVQKAAGKPFGVTPYGDVLLGVSCSAATACMAVGQYGVPYARPLAHRWNGTSWTSMKMPVPADSRINVDLQAVACTSATACTAVGSYELYNGSATLPWAVHWDGSSWTVKPLPVPGGTVRGRLLGVACASATSCTAVGGYTTQNGRVSDQPLVYRWDGTSWAQQGVPVPEGTQFAELNDVSCKAPAPCTAVGSYSIYSSSEGSSPLAERWDGTKWALQDAGYQALTDVACPTLTSCTALGGYAGAMGWDGAAWTGKGTPPGYSYGLACSAAADCMAVGGDERLELISHIIFAGVAYTHRGVGPTAARSSETQAAASAPAAAPRNESEMLTASGRAGSTVLPRPGDRPSR